MLAILLMVRHVILCSSNYTLDIFSHSDSHFVS